MTESGTSASKTRTHGTRSRPATTNQHTDPDVAGERGPRHAGLRAGMRFLDVAAGSGALSIPAARLGARVLATDQSPVMLELLEERARAEG